MPVFDRLRLNALLFFLPPRAKEWAWGAKNATSTLAPDLDQLLP
ncbi:hypothetical protein FVEN_g13076 [Fusarium venenatum]|nr:hypothetical protein FVEN_g13076 [Fusarium venenatum]